MELPTIAPGTIIASLSLLVSLAILWQGKNSSNKLDKILNHYQSLKQSPKWEVEDLRAKGEGRNPPFLVPEIKNTGDGVARNVVIEGRAKALKGDTIESPRVDEIETVYPDRNVSVNIPVRDGADAIRVKIDSDGEEEWKETIMIEDYELEDWFYEKVDV